MASKRRVSIDEDRLIEKFRYNEGLTGNERLFMLDLLNPANPDENKSESDDPDESKPRKRKKNKKLQCLFAQKEDSGTQTDFPDNLPIVPVGSKKLHESFDDRRNDILLSSPSVSSVQSEYPDLFCISEIRKEFGRIFYRKKCNEFFENVEKYFPTVLDKFSRNNAYFEKVSNFLEKVEIDSKRKYALTVCSLLMLPEIFQEPMEIFKLGNEECSSDEFPHIRTDATEIEDVFEGKALLYIMAENIKVGETTNFPEALLCLIAVFFIFNIEYTRECLQTYLGIEKLYLNCKECAFQTEGIIRRTQQMIKFLKIEASTSTAKTT